MSKLTIEQWFARAVAAGLVPDWDNVLAIYDFHYLDSWYLQDSTNNGIINCLGGIDIENGKYPGETIQLRKNGVDRVELWTTEDIPTEKNIGEMCWLLHDGNISLTTLTDLWDEMECNNEVMYHSTNIDSCLNSDEYKILLATNGNIAPKPEDFEKVYGEI